MRKRFCPDPYRRLPLSGSRYLCPMSRKSWHSQGSRYIHPCPVSDKSPSWLLLPACGSLRKTGVFSLSGHEHNGYHLLCLRWFSNNHCQSFVDFVLLKSLCTWPSSVWCWLHWAFPVELNSTQCLDALIWLKCPSHMCWKSESKFKILARYALLSTENFTFGTPIVFSHVFYYSCSRLFVRLVLTAHWWLDCMDDIVVVSVLRRYGVSIRVDVLALFVSIHSSFACVVLSSLGSSSLSGSLIRTCMRCGRELVANVTMVCFDIEMAFADRFVIYIDLHTR